MKRGGRKSAIPIGGVFGRLTVIAEAGFKYRRNGDRERRSLCRCICGAKVVVLNNRLQQGKTQSCGCLDRDRRRLPVGVAAGNVAIRVMKRSAKARGIAWEIADEAVRRLMGEPCHWCGRTRVNKITGHRYNGNPGYNGLDRINNKGPYSISNVWACCGECNMQRGSLTADAFLTNCKRIAAHAGLTEQHSGQPSTRRPRSSSDS